MTYMAGKHNKSIEYMIDQYKKGLNIEFVGLEKQLTVMDVQNHLTQKMGFETITSDLGISYIGNMFNGEAKPEEIPFDSVWLSIFKGEADPTLYGPPF